MRPGVVSVVLPIYGVEKYLDRCVTSIVNQTYSNLEIILVDDGSRDNCPQMCDAWAARDSRIKVVHKANAGLGMARNTGIENATGEYICFFDSDDYVALDTIEKAYALAKKEASDLVTFGLSLVDRNGNVVKSFVPKTDKGTYAGNEVQAVFLPDLIAAGKKSCRSNLRMSAWAYLYSMDLICRSNWRFVSEREIISEDVYSLLCLYSYVEKVSVLSEALYFYCENAESLSRVYREDRYERLCHFHKACMDKAAELGYKQEVIMRLHGPFISFAIGAMKMIVRAEMSIKNKYFLVKNIVESTYCHSVANAYDASLDGIFRQLFVFFLKHKCTLIVFCLLQLKK